MKLQSNHKYTEAELYIKYSALCAQAEYCIFDIRRKMQHLSIDPNCIDRVIQRLLKENFINESRYAHAFVRDKFRYNRWGRVRIALELRARGIDAADIDTALQELDDEDTTATLLSLLQKKLPSVKGNTDCEIKMKLMRFALSRGFEPDLVRKAVEEVMD